MEQKKSVAHSYAVQVFGNENYSRSEATAFLPPPPMAMVARSNDSSDIDVTRLLDDLVDNFQPPLSLEEQDRFLDVRELQARLRQMNNDHSTALASLIKTVHWYRREGISKYNAKMFSKKITTPGIYRRGFDREGRPIIWIRPGSLPWGSLTDLMTKLVIYQVERAIRSVPKNETDGRFTVIIDVNGVNWMGINYSWIKDMASLCLDHYPERVAKIHVFNGGFFISAAWSIIRPVLPQATVKKINFSENTLIDISFDYQEDWLKGGQCPQPYFDPDIYWKAESLYDQSDHR